MLADSCLPPPWSHIDTVYVHDHSMFTVGAAHDMHVIMPVHVLSCCCCRSHVLSQDQCGLIYIYHVSAGSCDTYALPVLSLPFCLT